MTTRISKRITANRDARSVVGSRRDLAVLASLAWARLLATGQVERLHFPSRRTAQRRLRALLDHDLVRAHLQGDALLQRENVYTLSPHGLETLFETGFLHGVDVAPGRVPRLQKLAHALAIRDLFVAYRLAEKEGLLQLTDFRFEDDLVREPVLRSARLIPDAVADMRAHGEDRRLFVEVDRARETTTTLRAKFTTWRALLVPAEAPFASPTTRLLVTVPHEARCRTVLRLLGETGIRGRADVVLASGLLPWIRADCSRAPYGEAVRAVRTGREPERRESVEFRVLANAAFRPLG